VILYPLSELTPLLPQQALGLPSAPMPAPRNFRGVALHWWTYGLPTQGVERKLAPTVPVRQWQWFGVLFTTLSLDHTDTPPQTEIERDKYLRHAVAIVLAHHTIPNPRTLAWEIKAGEIASTATLSVRPTTRVIGVKVWPAFSTRLAWSSKAADLVSGVAVWPATCAAAAFRAQGYGQVVRPDTRAAAAFRAQAYGESVMPATMAAVTLRARAYGESALRATSATAEIYGQAHGTSEGEAW
jgi:hypothetical protein